MLPLVVFLATAVAAATAASEFTCGAGVPCTVDCSGANATACFNRTINASSASSLALSCGELSSCLNTMVVCPTDGDCTVQCLDSFACDGTMINAYSSSTELHCVASDVNQGNICTNGVRINVATATAKSVRVNCTSTSAAVNASELGILVCDHISVVPMDQNNNSSSNFTTTTTSTTTSPTTNTTTSTTSTTPWPSMMMMTNDTRLELAFDCTGDGIYCESIDINVTDSSRLTITGIGAGSRVNSSRFVHSGDLTLFASGTTFSSNVFTSTGTAIDRGVSNDSNHVTVHMSSDAVLSANDFTFFGDFSHIDFIAAELAIANPQLLNRNSITIRNTSSALMVNLTDIAGDSSNLFYADDVAQLVLACSAPRQSRCGNFGTFQVANSLQLLNISVAADVNSNSSTSAFKVRIEANAIDRVNMTLARNASFESVNISSLALGRLSLQLLQGNSLRTNDALELLVESNVTWLMLHNGVFGNLRVDAARVDSDRRQRVNVSIVNATVRNTTVSARLSATPQISVTCTNSTCDSLRIENANGASLLRINATGNVTNSYVSGYPLLISAQGAFGRLSDSHIDGVLPSAVVMLNAADEFTIANNILELHANAVITTTGNVSFYQNIMRGSSAVSQFNLSLVSSAISFNKTDEHVYNFNSVPGLVLITLTASQALENSVINVYDPDAAMMITNQGSFFGNTISSLQRNLFTLTCAGVSYDPHDAMAQNTFNLPSVSDAVFSVGEGDIWNEDYIAINLAQNASISMVAEKGGTISRVPVNDALSVTLENDYDRDGTAPFGVTIVPDAHKIEIDAENAGLQFNAEMTGYTIERTNIWSVAEIPSTFEFTLNNSTFHDNTLVMDVFTTVNLVGDDGSEFGDNSIQIYASQNYSAAGLVADLVLSINSEHKQPFSFSLAGPVDGVALVDGVAEFVNFTILNSAPPFMNNHIDARNISEFLIFGDSFTFTQNAVRLNSNGTFNLSGAGVTQTLNNTFSSSSRSSSDMFCMSMWNGPAGVEFVQTGDVYTFDRASYISLNMSSSDGILRNKRIEFLGNTSTVYINSLDGGQFLNNSLNAKQLHALRVVLNGNSSSAAADASAPNVYNIASVLRDVSFSVWFPDSLTPSNTRFNISDVGVFQLVLGNGSMVSDIVLDDIRVRDSLLITNYNGTMNNVSVLASEVDVFNFSCFGGCRYTTAPNTFSLTNISTLSLNAANQDSMDLSTMQKMTNLNSAQTLYVASLGSETAISGANFGNFTALEAVLLEAFGGRFEHMQIDATKASSVAVSCFDGGCNQSVSNEVVLDKVSALVISASNDTINETIFSFSMNDNSTQIGNIVMTASQNALISGISIAVDSADSVDIYADHGGQIDNVRITPKKIGDITINNQDALITSLMVEPQTVHLIVVQNFGELSHSVIDAETAQILNILCAPNTDDNNGVFCNNLTVYVPEPSTPSEHVNASLICSNTGCQNMIFHTANGIDDIEITLRDCPCETAVSSSCVSEQFAIYCNASENEPSIFSKNECSGECCGDIVDELKITSCDYGGGSKKKQSKTGAIVGGICGALIGVVLIVFGFYYWKKQKTFAEEEVRQPLNS